MSSVISTHFLSPLTPPKAKANHEALLRKVESLSRIVNDAEDRVFAQFCQQIGVADIREYERRQLKVAQEESEARLRFDTQIARLTHQYVVKPLSLAYSVIDN